jgi:hypothetical protein
MYISAAKAACRRLFRQTAWFDRVRAPETAETSSVASTATMAMTVNSSTKVKPADPRVLWRRIDVMVR